jgi:Flp pilus assembly protein TadG
MTKDRIRTERGMTLVVVCLLLFALLAIAAICIDLGILYTARTSAQHAADAGALAGASTFLDNAAVQPEAAQQRAVAFANANKILGTGVSIGTGDVDVSYPTRTVTVTVSRLGANGISTFFARALGITTVPIQVRATAQASANATAANCVKPVFLPNTIFSSLNPDAACTAGEKIFNSDFSLTNWAKNAQGNFKFAGQCTPIRPTSPTGALLPGQFFSIDFGSGGNTYRDVWGMCLNQVSGVTTEHVACGDRLPVETGNLQGPTNQGVTDLTGTPPDTWAGPDDTGQFVFDTSTGPSYLSRSLAVVPVWDNCDPANGLHPGTNGQTIEVVGFVQIFVDGTHQPSICTLSSPPPPGNWVWTHAINAPTCSAAAGGGSGGGTGPLAVPIRLINVTP